MIKYQKIHTGSLLEKNCLRILLLFIICFSYSSASAQTIEINAENQPLNDLLYDFIEQHNLLLSFNDRALSHEKVTISGQFNGPEEVIDAVLAGTEFTYSREGEVYVIIKSIDPQYIISGWIGDKLTGESLPYAHIIINGKGFITDPDGRFIIEHEIDYLELSISYLGYFTLDTTIYAGMHSLLLIPSVHGLAEITVEGERVEHSMEFSDAPGQIRLNQKTARKIPGNGDNAVFNFLRLQPGIMAAGEQSSDLIIWGGYEGHSKVIFDGFTVYGLKNFNDNISAVNPYMTKDMLVLKGGYGAEYGGRVGGIVDITGIEGSQHKPTINLNINNMTLNGMASVPVTNQGALTLAFRRTYYNLYGDDDLQLPRIGNRRNISTDISVSPDYTFGDFNAKYSGRSNAIGSYALSLFRASDNFSYATLQERENVSIEQHEEESNSQTGGSIKWGRDLFQKLSTDITLSFSELTSELQLLQNVTRSSNRQNVFSREKVSGNGVKELGWKNRYFFTGGADQRYQLQAGIGYTYHAIQLNSRVDSEEQLNTASNTGSFSGYVTNNLLIHSLIKLSAGARIDHPVNIGKTYVQPRFSIHMYPHPNVNTYIAWGVYNQFIVKTSLLDDYGNYQYFWAISNNTDLPVLQSYHYVAGTRFQKNGITLASEAYFKTTLGLSRYVNLLRTNEIDIFQGDSRSYGVDILAKVRYNRHEAWASYSWSTTFEYFSYFPENEYLYAPHDQRHEIKTSVLFNLNPFYVSANYVYGSGLLLRQNLLGLIEPERWPYSRMDIALFYNLSLKDYTFEIGASVLNLFNTENVKISNFVRIPADQLSSVNIHAEAVPFTPAIFLNISF